MCPFFVVYPQEASTYFYYFPQPKQHITADLIKCRNNYETPTDFFFQVKYEKIK